MSNGYSGEQVAQAALQLLGERIVLTEEVQAESHVVIGTDGCEDAAVTGALGSYLTSALAGVVKADITLANQFLGAAVDQASSLRQRVERVAGRDNTSIDTHWRDTRRNPWIAEGFGHLLLFMSGASTTACLAGRVLALKALHAQASQQGLDLVAIYALEGAPAIAIGESKATRSDPSGQLTDAAGFFGRLEKGERDGDLVADLTMLEPVLSDALRSQMGPTVWERRRTYLPLVVYGVSFDPHAERQLLRDLAPQREHKRVIVLELQTFHTFFDEVANAMRAAVDTITL